MADTSFQQKLEWMSKKLQQIKFYISKNLPLTCIFLLTFDTFKYKNRSVLFKRTFKKINPV